MIFNVKSEPAVSPVIGTILLVAIAVVLVAIILVVVMGFSGDTNEKKVGLNAKSESGANATLILYGGASIDELVKLEMIDQGSANGTYVKFWDISEDDDAYVGFPYLAKDVARPEQSMEVYDTRINVRGTFNDGTEVILLVQPMTFYDVDVAQESIIVRLTVEPLVTGNRKGVTVTFHGEIDPDLREVTVTFNDKKTFIWETETSPDTNIMIVTNPIAEQTYMFRTVVTNPSNPNYIDDLDNVLVRVIGKYSNGETHVLYSGIMAIPYYPWDRP